MRSYKLTYQIDHHDPPCPQDQIPAGHGATDSIVMVSMLDTADGGLDLRVMSRDGNKSEDGDAGQLDPHDRFKVWMLWAEGLSRDPELDDNRRALAKAAWEMCRSTFARGSTDPSKN